MQWEHTRPTSRSLAGAELGKAGILRAVESPADLLRVSSPQMADFRGRQSWLHGWLRGPGATGEEELGACIYGRTNRGRFSSQPEALVSLP